MPESIYSQAFRRDRFRCVYCHAYILQSLDAFAASHLDHLKPRWAGGSDDLLNLARDRWGVADLWAVKTRRVVLASTAAPLASISATAFAGDMPAMPDSYLTVIPWLVFLYLPYTLILFPALVLVPAYLIRSAVSRGKEPSDARRSRLRSWRNWTLASLAPWLLVAVWVIYDVATNKSF